MRTVNYYYGYSFDANGEIGGFVTEEYDLAVFHKDFITVLVDVQDDDTDVLQAHRQKVAEKFGIEWD